MLLKTLLIAALIAVPNGLIDTTNPDTLGLETVPGVETATVFSPGATDNKYNHGVILMPFKGRLYAQWQSSIQDEDAPDTIVTYATSHDGLTWSNPTPLTAPRTDGYTSSGGWWTDGQTLVAYLNVWPRALTPRGGYAEYVTSTDGVTWSVPKRVTGADGQPVNGIIEQDVKALPSGRVLTAFHVQPGLFVKPYYTDDPLGVTGWRQGAFTGRPLNSGMDKELEPSWFRRPDGSIVMVFRDQGGSFRKLAAVSTDEGATWSASEQSNIPDSRTKQSAGNLPDGTAYLVGNPTGTRNRFPLSVLTSADGENFDRAYNLRTTADLQPLRYPGQFKSVGYSYPKSVVWNGFLYAAYGTNKEDVQVTRVPLGEISRLDGATARPAQGTLSNDNGWDTGLKDGDYTITMNLWWGTPGASFRLYENGTLVAVRPGASPATVALKGRKNGVYVYTGELVNSQGVTATSSTTVTVTQATPGKPVLSKANGKVTANLWWGTNATSYRILEDGVVVAEGPLAANTPGAQSASAPLSAGVHTYVAEFTNAAGTTTSDPLT
ncbi:exo-alpha-sialidase [Herbidospora sp. RD11066]